jgi:hypothetical protein
MAYLRASASTGIGRQSRIVTLEPAGEANAARPRAAAFCRRLDVGVGRDLGAPTPPARALFPSLLDRSAALLSVDRASAYRSRRRVERTDPSALQQETTS